MRRLVPSLTVALALGAAALRAQERQNPPPQRVDESDAAAEAMRRLLGLKPGPAKDTPQDPRPRDARDIGPLPPPGFVFAVRPRGDELLGPPLPSGEIPKPAPPIETKPEPPPRQPTDDAAEAMRRLMPTAKQPEEAPIRPKELPPVPAPPLDPPQDHKRPSETDLAAQRMREVDLAKPQPLAATPPREVPELGVPIHGSLQTRYRGRHAASSDDQEVFTVLGFDVGDPERHPVTFHFVGRGYADLDGGETRSTFRSIEDTFGRDITGRIYDAYFDLHAVPGLSRARLGRHTILDTPVPLFLDGLDVQTRRLGRVGAWFEAFGGVPVRLFEQSRSGDLAVGGAAGLTPWQGGRARVDYLHLEDRVRTGGLRDELLGMSLWQTLGDVDLFVRHTRLGSEARDLQARVNARFDELGLRLRLNWDQLLTTQRALVTELDPYFETLFEYDPYHQLGASFEHDLGAHLGWTGGVDVRRLRDRHDDRPFNREFERYYLGPTWRALEGRLTADVIGELWDTAGEHYETVSGGLRWKVDEHVTLAVRSSYALYQLDLLNGRERDRVRVYGVSAELRPTKAWRVDVRYDFEDDDLGQFHVFTANMSCKF